MAAQGSGPRSVLFVHAHPDDESITTGGTMALLAEGRVQVALLTCTRGERGEVIPAELQHLLADPEGLAEHRDAELARAAAELGVATRLYLGEPGARRSGLAPRRYLDSGMRWGSDGPEALHQLDPDCLCAAELAEVAGDVAAAIATLGPDAVIGYDRGGGYGHPDHIRAHHAARLAAEAAGLPFYAVLPATESPRDDDVLLDVRPVLDRKRAALAAHRSQVTVEDDSFRLSNGVSQPIGTVEAFRRDPVDMPAVQGAPAGRGSTVVGCGLALLAGAVVGLVATVNHQSSLPLLGIAVPYGLILAVAAVAGLLIGLRMLAASRWVATCAAIGAIAIVGLFSLQSPGGSVLTPGNALGYCWAFAPAIVALLTIGWPRSRDPSGRRPSG